MQKLSPAVMGGGGERRRNDRRRLTLRSVLFGGFGKNRRRGPRRLSDRRAHYVDWYDHRLLCVSMGIFALCCTDAAFTLALIDRGAREVNLFMQLLIQQGINTFVGIKLGITYVALIYLVAHSSFRVRGLLQVRHALYLLFFGYVALFFYQLNLLATVPSA